MEAAKSIGIVGTGAVGTACASSIIQKNIVSSLKLYDYNVEKNRGVCMDLEDEAFKSGVLVIRPPGPVAPC